MLPNPSTLAATGVSVTDTALTAWNALGGERPLTPVYLLALLAVGLYLRLTGNRGKMAKRFADSALIAFVAWLVLFNFAPHVLFNSYTEGLRL